MMNKEHLSKYLHSIYLSCLSSLKKGAEVTVTAVKLLKIAHFRAKSPLNLDVTSAPAVTVTFFQETHAFV